MKKKVLIAPSTFGATDASVIKKLSNAGFEIVNNPFGRKLNKKELLELLPGINGIIAGLETIDQEVLERTELKVISRCGAGTDNIDLPAAQSLGIKVYSTPDAPTLAVAEITVGAMLVLLRSVAQMDRDLHQGKWSKKTGYQLTGKKILIVGFGRIGRCVAELLEGFKNEIIVVDPNIGPQDRLPEGIKIMTLDKAIPLADIVTLHARGEKEIIGKKEFALMKKGVFLLNCARGTVINESALIAALDNGQVAGAWFDTFSEEPYSGPLGKYGQVLLTPHIGSYTRECRMKMEMQTVDNLIAGFKELEVEKR